MTRYWVSWWAMPQDFVDGTPWTVWYSGHRFIEPSLSVCAVIDAASEDDVWQSVSTFFPEHERRFISAKPTDWTPGDRFGNAPCTRLAHGAAGR